VQKIEETEKLWDKHVVRREEGIIYKYPEQYSSHEEACKVAAHQNLVTTTASPI
jgi:hypothetical protein